MKRVVFVLFLVLLFFETFALAGNEDRILGLWSTPDNDCEIEIFKTGSKYFGRIVWLKEPFYPADDAGGMAGKPIVDRENPNKKLRSRPLIGLPLIHGFVYVGKNVWGKGTIYNPDNGKTYRCKMTLASRSRLEVRGYFGVPLLGGTSVWTRQSENFANRRELHDDKKSKTGLN